MGDYFLGFIGKVKNLSKVLGSLNTTFLAVMSKYDNSESFDEFKCISICNCVYKIISKGLVVRSIGVL